MSDSVASCIAEMFGSDARWRPGYKPRRFILSDAAAPLSRLAMADVAMVTSWKEFWSWTERAFRQETSLEACASLVGLLRSPNPLFWGFFFLHATLMEHFSLFYQFESSVRCAYSVFWLLEQACEFTLSQHGPFTAFIPVGQNPFQVGWSTLKNTQANSLCFMSSLCFLFFVTTSRLSQADTCRKILQQHPECSV